jgi:hypothetical protein
MLDHVPVPTGKPHGSPASPRRRWNTTVAGLPCTIDQQATDGVWTVTIASATVGRSYDLVIAILDAGCGLVLLAEAQALAATLEDQSLRGLPAH